MADANNKAPQVESSADESDRRYFPRWEVDNKVLYHIENDPIVHECRSVDINCTGACIKTDDTLVPNQNLKLTIYLDKNVTISVNGTIIWSKPLEKENIVGINFSNMSQKMQETILKYAFEFNKDSLVQHWFKGWNDKK